MTRLPVAVFGATGVAGRQALAALDGHPWFRLERVASSSRNAGKRLGEALPGFPLSERVAALVLEDVESAGADGVGAVFSTLPSRVATALETRLAETTPVISTASSFRMEPDTPLLLAGVNPLHAELLESQRRARGWSGWVAPNPNCTTVGLAVTLEPLTREFGVDGVVVTSFQAISGAGSRSPEVAERVRANVLPYIPGEEEKVESELLKILGGVENGAIRPAAFPVSATCTRVPVSDGHSLSISVRLGRTATPDEVASCLAGCDPWRGRDLPSCPQRWIRVRSEEDRPQPLLDRDEGGGLTTVVGRLRPDRVVGGVKYFALSHNAVMGAAGGAVLLAEDLYDRGYFR